MKKIWYRLGQAAGRKGKAVFGWLDESLVPRRLPRRTGAAARRGQCLPLSVRGSVQAAGHTSQGHPATMEPATHNR